MQEALKRSAALLHVVGEEAWHLGQELLAKVGEDRLANAGDGTDEVEAADGFSPYTDR